MMVSKDILLNWLQLLSMNEPHVLDTKYRSFHEWWMDYVKWKYIKDYSMTEDQYDKLFDERTSH